ncbi:hypothetical protein GCK72_015070 [Caenorhabditis remanei]|uniref:Acyl_transf_3 domain-containing protein n=1 Tax=Caenorhabditis remanei TaxID=31234 RepID=A0A6A5GVI8_CAERE|nr:hypothetical protein GCK72_015070 [Caenorhabditis remanei]KAF1758611.1 hypothetical protein GCK72_015070 [Caenorhabditis remanei]
MDRQKPKRLDLQGIRGIAILLVLGFHFFPEFCPNGYLGVDQFFVLSGFLMCMLLKRAENQSTCYLITLFYSKRFKRILPLYLLIIFISMICLYLFFPSTSIETNQESAIQALLFVSNRPKTTQEDYFQLLAIAVDIFTHTWSLSVEIQFYFLVPFIFLFAVKVPEKFQLGYYGTIGFISFVYYNTLPPTLAFNSVYARIWQFLIGMVVYLLGVSKPQFQYQVLANEGDEEEELECQQHMIEEESNSASTIFSQHAVFVLLAFLISVTAYPHKLPALAIRPVITVGTGLLMLFTEDNIILSNRVLTYIGDISYSLYLIHWPIYAYWKLTCDGDTFLLISALVGSVILAIITYETYEKWYLKLSSTNVYKLAIIGNSWAANHGKMFYQECSSKAKSIMQGSAFACEPLYATGQTDICKANLTDFQERVKKEKPDYAFIITRFKSIGDPWPKGVKSFKNDKVYQTMKEQMLKFLPNIKYKLYILDSIPQVDSRYILKIVGLLKNNTNLVNIDKKLVRHDGYEMARSRHAQLIKDCKGRCEMIDYLPEFYNNATKTFRYFDERGFSYWTMPSHLSPHGIEHIRHLWTDICRKL